VAKIWQLIGVGAGAGDHVPPMAQPAQWLIRPESATCLLRVYLTLWLFEHVSHVALSAEIISPTPVKLSISGL